MKTLSPINAIKSFCITCNGEKKQGTRYDCMDHNCVMYPYKPGKGVYERPEHQPVTKEHQAYLDKYGTDVKMARKGREISEKEKEAFSERMKKAWITRKHNSES